MALGHRNRNCLGYIYEPVRHKEVLIVARQAQLQGPA
jgi:hypothetical protein